MSDTPDRGWHIQYPGGNKADWKWEDDLQCHIPCCTTCGNGPLTGEQIVTGDCGEDHVQETDHDLTFKVKKRGFYGKPNQVIQYRDRIERELRLVLHDKEIEVELVSDEFTDPNQIELALKEQT